MEHGRQIRQGGFFQWHERNGDRRRQSFAGSHGRDDAVRVGQSRPRMATGVRFLLKEAGTALVYGLYSSDTASLPNTYITHGRHGQICGGAPTRCQ